MSKLARFQQQAQNVAAISIDMSEVSKGGAGRRLLPAGRAFARLIGYREFGKHVQTFNGKPKPPATMVRLTFALWGKADPTGPNSQENCYHIVNEDGTMKQHGIFTTFDIALGNNEKAKIKMGFDKMNWDKQHKGFASMLGGVWLLPITQKVGKKADNKPYNLIDWTGILPPQDPMTGQPYAIPDTVKDEEYFMFLWNAPTKEDWDDMFIEGENDKGQSKNFMQAMCRKATDFPGSPLEQLLLEIHGGSLPDLGLVETDEDPDTDGEQGAPEVPTVPGAQAAAPAVPNVPQVSTASPTVPADVPFEGAVPAATAVAAVPGVPDIPTVPGL